MSAWWNEPFVVATVLVSLILHTPRYYLRPANIFISWKPLQDCVSRMRVASTVSMPLALETMFRTLNENGQRTSWDSRDKGETRHSPLGSSRASGSMSLIIPKTCLALKPDLELCNWCHLGPKVDWFRNFLNYSCLNRSRLLTPFVDTQELSLVFADFSPIFWDARSSAFYCICCQHWASHSKSPTESISSSCSNNDQLKSLLPAVVVFISVNYRNE